MTFTFKKQLLATGLVAAGMLVYAAPAAAQATRTWVSGVGDDVNPCSRTAPCKTFAGAISKTAAGGEINCLDPGGFGAVTITKSLTIDCHYTEGGALAGGNGIVVNAGVSDAVFIRGLDIFGVNPPTHGIRFIAGGALYVEDTVIRRFNAANSQGISFQPGGASKLYLSNVVVADNGNGATGGGILVQPTGTGSAQVVINNSRVMGNGNGGIRLDTTGNTGAAGSVISIHHSEVSGNSNGITVESPPGTTSAALMLVDSTVANNVSVGLFVDGPTALARVANTTITGNATGVLSAGGAVMGSFMDNRVFGNPTVGAANNGVFTGPLAKN